MVFSESIPYRQSHTLCVYMILYKSTYVCWIYMWIS